jgi:hypothetical protein
VKLHEIDTPALLLDLDATERSLAKMARFSAAGIIAIVDSSVSTEVSGSVEIWVHSDATVNRHDRRYGVLNEKRRNRIEAARLKDVPGKKMATLRRAVSGDHVELSGSADSEYSCALEAKGVTS